MEFGFYRDTSHPNLQGRSNNLTVVGGYVLLMVYAVTACQHGTFGVNCLKTNSITLSGSNQLRTSSEPDSVMEFGFYRDTSHPNLEGV